MGLDTSSENSCDSMGALTRILISRQGGLGVLIFADILRMDRVPLERQTVAMMQPITTKFTRLMKINSPIVAAPMYYASTPGLVTAVTIPGAFGFIAAGFDSPEQLKKQLQDIRSQLKIPNGLPVPTGVGLLGWILDRTEGSDAPRIPSVLQEMPSAIWFAFGNDLGKYVAQVRAYDEKRAHKTIVFVIVNSVAEALRAANEWKVDVLVVQGIEAGGHGSSDSPPLFNLLQDVLISVPNGPAIIAAGGISTGAQIASLLTMGADGVVLGTRFLLTPECMYSDDMKSVLLDAGLNSTIRGYVFDEINRTPSQTAWPKGIDGRAIANDIVTDYNEGLGLSERLKLYDEGKSKGEKDRLLIWAGIGAGHVKEIKPATNVLQDLHSEAVTALKAVLNLI